MKINLREAEKLTGLTRGTIQKRIEAGKIIAQKEGNRYLIEESELAKLPKPRNTGMQSVTQNVEVPKGGPFSETIKLEAVKAIRAMTESTQAMTQTANELLKLVS